MVFKTVGSAEWGGLARVFYVYVLADWLSSGRFAGRRSEVGRERLAIVSTRPVVLHVVIRPKPDPILDDQGGRIGNFELKPIVSAIPGREFAEFRTVRPRVQIPGSRPICEFEVVQAAELT